MRISPCRPLFVPSFIISLFAISIFLTSCGSTANNTGENMCFGKLPLLYKDYSRAYNKLMKKYRKTVNQAEKEKIRASCKGKEARLIKNLQKLDKIAHLVGKKIPFKISGILPFKMVGSQIKEITKDHLKFSISVKTRKRLPVKNGITEQSIKVYFVAIDTNGDEIPNTANFATTKAKVHLSSSTKYDTEGLLKAESMEKMGNFDYLRIMNEAAYNKIKGQ